MDLLFIAPAVRDDPARRPLSRRQDRRRATSRPRSCGRRAWAGACWRWAASAWRIALNYGQVYPDLHPRLVLTATLLAVLLFEIVASREASAFILESGQPSARSRPVTDVAAPAAEPMIRRLVVLALLVGGAVLLEPLRVPTEGVIAPALALPLRHPAAHGRHLRRPGARPRVPPAGGLPGRRSGARARRCWTWCRRACSQDLGMMKQLAVGVIALLAGAELRVKRPGGSATGPSSGSWRSRPRRCWSVSRSLVLLLPALDPVPRRARGGAAAVFVALLFAATLTVNSPDGHPGAADRDPGGRPAGQDHPGRGAGGRRGGDPDLHRRLQPGPGEPRRRHRDGAPEILRRLLREVVGSMLAGALVGGVLTLYLRFVRRELVVFAVVLVFATAAAAQALHFELLLSLLVAGFLVENVAPVRAEPLVEVLHLMAVPVFVDLLRHGGGRAPAPDLRRRSGRWSWRWRWSGWGWSTSGSTAGARMGRAEPVVTRYAWTGLVSQAGVALGLATIVADRLPRLGLAMQTLIVGIIAFNESVGPVLFRRGSIGRGRSGSDEGVDLAVCTAG